MAEHARARALAARLGWLGLALWLGLAAATLARAQPESAPPPGGASPQAFEEGGRRDEPLIWRRIRGQAVDIAISAAGIVYSVDPEGRLWRWRGEARGWTLMPRRFRRVSAEPDGKPVAVGEDGLVYRYNGLWWDALGSATVRDVAAGGDGRIFAISTGGALLSWQREDRAWAEVGGSDLRRVSVDQFGRALVIDGRNRVRRVEDGIFDELPGEAADISIGPGGAVFIAAPDGTVYRRNFEEGAWEAELGAVDAVAVAVGPGGFPWIVDEAGRIFGTADFGPERREEEPAQRDLFADSDQRLADRLQVVTILPEVTDPSPFVFTRVPGLADEIAIGRDGSVFISDTSNQLFRFSNAEMAFVAHPGVYENITVRRDGAVYGVGLGNNVFLQDGARVTLIPDGITRDTLDDFDADELDDNIDADEIDVGPEGTLFITDTDNRIFRLNSNVRRFIDTKRFARAIAVDPGGKLWGIDPDGILFRCDTLPCRAVPTGIRLIELDIGPDGSIFVVAENNRLFLLSPADGTLQFVRADVAEVAVGPRGRPWIIDTGRRVFATTFFRRDETADEALEREVFAEQGVVSPSITFTKRYRFQRVEIEPVGGFVPEFFVFDAGPDGSVVLVDDPGTGPIKWQFVPQSNAMRPDDDPPPPAIPSSFTLRSIGVVNEDRIYYFALGSLLIDFLYFPVSDTALDLAQFSDDPGVGARDFGLGGEETALVIGGSRRIFEFVRETETFRLRFADPIYDRISVDPEGLPWVIDVNDRVRRFDGKKDEWVIVAGGRHRARDIDVGPTGEVFIIDTDNQLLRYNVTNDDFDRVTGVGPAFQVAVDADGLPWVQVGLDPPAFTSFGLFRARLF